MTMENILAFATPAPRDVVNGIKEHTAKTTLNEGRVGPAFSTF